MLSVGYAWLDHMHANYCTYPPPPSHPWPGGLLKDFKVPLNNKVWAPLKLSVSQRKTHNAPQARSGADPLI